VCLQSNPDLGVNSVVEFVSLLKKNPGKYNFASIGNGSLSHLAMEAQAKAGAVKILAVSRAHRLPYLPNVPTLKEAGIDVEADAWNGLIAPGGTPKSVAEKISKDVSHHQIAGCARKVCHPVDGAGRLLAGRLTCVNGRRNCPLGAGDQGNECENKLRCRVVFHILDVNK